MLYLDTLDKETPRTSNPQGSRLRWKGLSYGKYTINTEIQLGHSRIREEQGKIHPDTNMGCGGVRHQMQMDFSYYDTKYSNIGKRTLYLGATWIPQILLVSHLQSHEDKDSGTDTILTPEIFVVPASPVQ